MKKTLLCMLLFVGFQTMANVDCKQESIPVNSIAELNAAIDYMELNSVDTETTIIIQDGIYNSSATESLNRDIDVEGGCPCTIKAQNADPNEHELFLKGDVSWRLNNSNNLTIDGIVFRRTENVNVNPNDRIPLIFLDAQSHTNVIKNSIFMEFASTSIPPFTDIYPFLRVNRGNEQETGNVIDNCIFQNKYSNGNYVELIGTKNVKISNSKFRETDTSLFTGKPEYYRYIYSIGSTGLKISNSFFYNKYSNWNYIQLNNGTDNTISNNTFYETADPNDADIPKESIIIDSGSKDYIKIVDEMNPSITSNEFLRKFSLGTYVNYAPTKNGDDEMTTIFGGTISNNKFLRQYKKAPSSMLRIGSCYSNTDGEVARTNVIVSNNIFEEYSFNGHYYSEIISNKSSGNEYYDNEFINCFGSLRIRCGDEIIIKGNKFTGNNDIDSASLGFYQRGIAISGKRHEIYNNHFKDLTFFAFDIYGGTPNPDIEVDYVRVEDVNFAFNTIVNCALSINFRKEDGAYDEMALRTRIENNIFYNVNSLGTHIFVNIDNDYGGPTHVDDISHFHTNSFQKNIFYNNASHPHLITPNNTNPHDPLYDWSLPNGSVTYTINPELSYDAVDEIYKLTAGSNAINASYADSMDPNYYSYVTDDILGNLRDDVARDIGCHEYNGAASRATTNPIGLFENANTKLQSYPNPVDDMITLTGVSDESLYVIYNINGVKVLEGTVSNNQQIKVEKLSKGIYFLTINNAETIKLIKN